MGIKKDNISLEEIKDAFIKVLDEHIEVNNFQKLINNIPNLGMGEIITLYESISEKLLESKSGRNVIKKYINIIKENKDLKNVYSFYNFVKTSNINENHEACLNEAINCIGTINKKKYENGVKKLGEIVSEGVLTSKISKNEINSILENTNTIYSDIDFVLFNKKNIKNVNEHVKHKNNVVNFLKENKNIKTELNTTNNISNKDIINDINEIIGNVNESWAKELIENITVNNIAQLSNEPLFESYKNDCITLINTIIENENDISSKSQMLSMKENLEKKVYKDDSFYTDIINLAELKTTLNENIYEN
jgi:hypothetical protein